MFTSLHWIDTSSNNRLAIAARPRSGDWLEDEIQNWSANGARLVVSLLEQHEVEDLGLQAEPDACERMGIAFKSFPIPDRGIPESESKALALADYLARYGQGVVIHCRAGIGRSSIIAAAVLVTGGTSPVDALSKVEAARGLQVPDTELQRAWVLGLVPSR